MRCTNKKRLLVLCVVLGLFLTGCKKAPEITSYEKEHYNAALYEGALFAKDLCVTDTDVTLDGYMTNPTLHASGLFDLQDRTVVHADRIFDRIFPASTTKVLTAYVTLKYGNLEDMVTVGPNATGFAADEQVCGLQTGDTVSLYDLLCGLVLHSGNDNAVAIAEHLAGSVEGFADMMNAEARALGATGTHFVNPHGLQDDNHYTTAYDLYLMFDASLKDQRFVDIISMESYVGTLTDTSGVVRTIEWLPTNYYSRGVVAPPDGITVFGGKTGTTNEAGSCVILFSQRGDGKSYISVVMGADEKETLYNEMTALIAAGAGNIMEQ